MLLTLIVVLPSDLRFKEAHLKSEGQKPKSEGHGPLYNLLISTLYNPN